MSLKELFRLKIALWDVYMPYCYHYHHAEDSMAQVDKVEV